MICKSKNCNSEARPRQHSKSRNPLYCLDCELKRRMKKAVEPCIKCKVKLARNSRSKYCEGCATISKKARTRIAERQRRENLRNKAIPIIEKHLHLSFGDIQACSASRMGKMLDKILNRKVNYSGAKWRNV